VNISKVQLF